jgi:sugar phosphate permease
MAETDEARSKRARRTAFALSWLAYASYYLGRKGLSVTKAALAAELGLGTPALAWIDTAFLATYALGQVPSGVAADRLGARRLVGLGLLGSAAACVLFGASSSASVFVVAFGLNGFAQATGWPGTTKVMAEHTTPSERGRVMGWWSTCYQVGGIAATALATFLLAHFGWRSAFAAPAAWLAAVGIAVLVWLPTTHAPHAPGESATEQPATLARAARRALLRSPVLYGYGACYFCIKLIRYSLLFWLPYYLHTSAGFDTAKSGYLSISFELGGVIGAVGLGHLSDRFGGTRSQAALWSLLGLAAALLLYARLGTAGPLAHFAAMMLIGVLLFGPDALLSGAAAQDAGGPHAAATAVGIVNGLGSAGALLQGALTVGVQQAFGWNALFYVFVGLALLAAACLMPTLRTRRA